VTNYVTAAGTLTTGWDNTSTVFSGSITNPFVQGLLSVSKIGSGAWILTGSNRATDWSARTSAP